MTTQIYIKTRAYSQNLHYIRISAALREAGYKATPNVSEMDDTPKSRVRIDTNAPLDFVVGLGMPKAATVTRGAYPAR